MVPHPPQPSQLNTARNSEGAVIFPGGTVYSNLVFIINIYLLNNICQLVEMPFLFLSNLQSSVSL